MSNKNWSLLFGGVILLEFLLFVAAPIFGWWLPKSISSYAGRVDGLFYIILAVTAVAFVLTEAVLVYNLYRAAAQPSANKAPYVHGNHKLELIWTLVPGVLLLLLAILQINVWAEIKYPASMQPGKDTLQVEITARQWEWRMRYPGPSRLQAWEKGTDTSYEHFRTVGFEDRGQADDVHQVNQLHVVQGEKVLVWLKTRDVIHSFFLPNVRVKQDALPGKTIPLWFQVEKRQDGNNYNCQKNEQGEWQDGFDPGNSKYDVREQYWELACAEYCGTRHSLMRGKLYVHKDRKDFLDWLQSAKEKQDAGEEKK